MSLDDTFVPEAGAEEVNLGVDLDTIPPQHAVPEGEYKLVLVDAVVQAQKAEKGTGKFIMAKFEIADDEDAKLITHVMMLPGKEDKARQQKARLRAIGDFYKTFGIPGSGSVRLADYIGKEGYATLRMENSVEYGDQNKIAKFVTGR